MRTIQAALTTIALALSLLACGTSSAQQPASDPQPGSMLSGTILMGDSSGGDITLRVSDNGTAISHLAIYFLIGENQAFREVNAGRLQECESGFSGDILSQPSLTNVPITNGRFEATEPWGIISGHFDTPTTASGTIHLFLRETLADCGSWPWIASDIYQTRLEVVKRESICEEFGRCDWWTRAVT